VSDSDKIKTTASSNPSNSEYIATEEIDQPLFTESSYRRAATIIKPAPMSAETEKKLEYGWRIIRICFIIILCLAIFEVIFAFTNRAIESTVLMSVLDLMRTVILLAAGFIFGNQSKN